MIASENIVVRITLAVIVLANACTSIRKWNKTVELPVCKHLPSTCHYDSNRRQYEVENSKWTHKNRLSKSDWLICDSGFDPATAIEFERYLNACLENKPKSIDSVGISFSFSFRLSSRWSILNDSSFHLFKLISIDDLGIGTLRFINLKGFDINSKILIPKYKISYVEIYTDFNLYKNNRLLTDCRDYLENANLTNESSRRFIFTRVGDLQIFRPKPAYPICSLFFRNADIGHFKITIMANSMYFKNSISFSDPDHDPNMTDLNSDVFRIDFLQIYMVDLDSKLVHPQIFANVFSILIGGNLNSIGPNVFSSFHRLTSLFFRSDSIFDLIRRQGIEWIKGINVNTDVDLTNPANIVNRRVTKISFEKERFDELTFFRQDEGDFCLFFDFPFRQMVYITADSPLLLYQKNKLFTCTQLWLYQHLKFFKSRILNYDVEKRLNDSNFTACEFEKRIQMCNRSHFSFAIPQKPTYTWFDVMVGLEFSFLIIVPSLFGASGIITNILVIRVIFDKKNAKTMRKKQYIYMSLHCLSNVLICFIQFVNLLNECQYPYGGLFCSSMRHLKGIQYVNIILGENLNSVLRLVSNFAYFGFSICRLAKIGNNHSKFTTYVNEKLSIKIYIIVVVIVSAGLSVCKSLQFHINFDYPHLAYPLPFIQNPYENDTYKKRNWGKSSKFLAIYVINIIYNFINYFLFVFVHLIVDLMLIRKLRRVMQEKEKKAIEMKKTDKEMDKLKKENEESNRRAVTMVICNSTINFLLKIPILIPSLNDFRLLFYNINTYTNDRTQIFNEINMFSSPFNFEFYCVSEKSCQIFQSFGNCLYLASFSLLFFFLKHFDMNFKCACQQTFRKSISSTNNKK